MTSDVHILGVFHLDRLSIIQCELRERVEATNADAVFIEYPAEKPDITEWCMAFFRLPLVLGGYVAYSIISLGVYALVARSLLPPERRAAQVVADEGNIPLYDVDPHVRNLWSSGGIGLVTLNWVLLGGATLFLSPYLVGTTYFFLATALGGIFATARLSRRIAAAMAPPILLIWFILTLVFSSVWFVIFCIIANTVVIFLTIDERDEIVLEQTRKIMASEGFDRVVLICGNAHVNDLIKRVDDASDLSLSSVWLRRAFRRGIAGIESS